jgi:hypothetical protein
LFSTTEKQVEQGKKAVDAPPAHLGWDTHQAVEKISGSLVRETDGGPEGNYPMRSKFEKLCRDAQISITKAIEEIDGSGKQFQEDCWTRENGGGGMSRVLTNGNVFEKAGVNLSVVYGSMPQEALQAATERGVDRAKGMAPGERVPFFACGLSSVMHPKNPFCPTMHFNYRYFETDGGVWWFGGTHVYIFIVGFLMLCDSGQRCGGCQRHWHTFSLTRRFFLSHAYASERVRNTTQHNTQAEPTLPRVISM